MITSILSCSYIMKPRPADLSTLRKNVILPTMLKKIIITTTLLTLIGCGKTPPKPEPLAPPAPNRALRLAKLDHFHVLGKMGYKTAKDGGNANVDWNQMGKQYKILFAGPMGSGAVRISNVSGDVVLKTASGEEYLADTPELLMHQLMGWDLPVSGLRYWLAGRVAPNASKPTLKKTDALGRLTELHQDNWQIHYQRYETFKGLSMPTKMSLQQGSISLKLIFRSWSFTQGA